MRFSLFWLLTGGLLQAQQKPVQVPEDVEVLRDVEFGTGGGRALRMHLVRPKAAAASPRPVVIFVHGGAWRVGSRDLGIGPLSRLAQRGYFGVSVEYRLSQEAKFPAQIHDVKCAVRFLRAKAKEYYLDPDRIAAWGSSAGGHLVALLGTSGGVKELEGEGGWPEHSSRIQAVVDWCGPTDFLKMGKNRIDHDLPDSPESQLVGGPIHENPEKVAAANPVMYVSKDDPPFLIMHGDKDDLVPLAQSELLHAALEKAGVVSTLHVVKGAGHSVGKANILPQVDAFLDQHLKRPDR